MTDDHHDLTCRDCGETPTLVRLGSEKPTEHAAYGVECGCVQSDGTTPVGAYVDLNNMPEPWGVTGGGGP
ncbi:hypothetical protein DQW50_16290 [Halorubrum sp. 48-1-W]|uniref:hypothetical protein n=1 Tax=Halorubrum sp. 48-1-W TaxID=2249761 RepID=UPI000DCBBE4A|nr:hypothetical protein [Halorubrum sp. 48-1-W]RAW44081.1 hypothetical protein DQW50_16290 [Halorubrum sp. 48-1-W]